MAHERSQFLLGIRDSRWETLLVHTPERVEVSRLEIANDGGHRGHCSGALAIRTARHFGLAGRIRGVRRCLTQFSTAVPLHLREISAPETFAPLPLRNHRRTIGIRGVSEDGCGTPSH